jgi:TolB-like protein/DNA-binding winged helix-turn-helix (wHTH) protein
MPLAEGSAQRMPSIVSTNETMPDRALQPKAVGSGRHRFGAFEVDFHAGELRKSGMRINIQDQPLQALSILLDRPGEVITREEFRDLLWPEHTFVDFDHSLNSAIRKVRNALDDHPDMPHLIETLPRHGYRFIGPAPVAVAPVQDAYSARGDVATDFAQVESQPFGAVETSEEPRPEIRRRLLDRRRPRPVAMAAGFLLLAAALLAGVYWSHRRAARPTLHPTVTLAVIPLNNLGPDASADFIAEGMTEELITQLGKAEPGLGVIAHTSVEQYKHTTKPVSVIGKELAVDYLLEGSARVEGDRLRIAVQLIRVSDQTHIWAESYDSTLDDMLSVQARVANSVTTAIQEALKSPPRPAMKPFGPGTTPH